MRSPAQDKAAEAASSFEQAVRIVPNHVQALASLGQALHCLGKVDEAKAVLERSLRLRSDYPIARFNLGNVLQFMGDFTGAEREYRAVLRDHPHHAFALWQLASLLRAKLPEADRAAIDACLAQLDLNDSDRSKLLFGLALVYDARGEYGQAAAQLRQANALMQALDRQRKQAYEIGEDARFVDKIVAAFTPAFFERTRGFGLDTDRPVFIVGLPRSGTTLIEQILAAHSQVFGAGEVKLARADYLALEKQVFSTPFALQQDTVRLVAQRYLDQLRDLNSTATRVVDKMPNNFFLLGFLATLFPRAKFIHCRRDLRDVAVSCWMTHFVEIHWTNDPRHIATRFREYLRVAEHWRAVLPVPVLEVNYEEIVTDLPGMARRLVAWCGLEWEPACLKYHESTRPICTASVTQARQPIYASSVGRWRNYESELSGLFAAIEPLLEPPT